MSNTNSNIVELIIVNAKSEPAEGLRDCDVLAIQRGTPLFIDKVLDETLLG